MKKDQVFLFKIIFVTVVFLISSLVFVFVGIKVINKDEREVMGEDAFLRRTVIIDAGHGGRDAGASHNDVLEKDLNLLVSKKLEKMLSYFDVNVLMTRKEDVLLASEGAKNSKREDLKNRLEISKNAENPIFLSVHMNKFPDEKYGGLQVFYSKNNNESHTLAELIQTKTKDYLDNDNTRMPKRAGSDIYLLDRLTCPSVLVECGFLSNREDLESLTNESYQNALAFVISNTIIQFIGS